MSKVCNPDGAYTEAFNEIDDQLRADVDAIRGKLGIWLRNNDADCIDVRLAWEAVISHMQFVAEGEWLSCRDEMNSEEQAE